LGEISPFWEKKLSHSMDYFYTYFSNLHNSRQNISELGFMIGSFLKELGRFPEKKLSGRTASF
jgi:hypothetical protein